jgi:hypothetical protein
MTMKRLLTVSLMLLALAFSSSASAQLVTTIDSLTLRQTLSTLTAPAGPTAGEALGMAAGLEIGTAPFGTSSGGFVTKLDPSTGLQVRTATTFGPSFANRALTSGEGKVSVGATFYYSKFDRLDDLRLSNLKLGGITSSQPDVARTALTSLSINSKTLVLSGVLGVTENLDIGVGVPLVTVEVNGFSTYTTGTGVVAIATKGGGRANGVGDIAAQMKYRFLKFAGGDLPDPGGLAVLVDVHMPTGDRDNLRGLGVTRTMVSGIFSAGKGRFRPHANGGYEFWSNGVDSITNFTTQSTVTARNQYQYAAGVEVEATPKLTLIADLVGRQILGAGKVGFVSTPVSSSSTGVTSIESTVTLPEGIHKLTLVPGLKVNLKGKMLLSLNALVSLWDNGLHARFTPVVGIDLTL